MHGSPEDSPSLDSSDSSTAETQPGEAANSENFYLSDFFALSGRTMKERTAPFSRYFAQLEQEGLLQYERELLSPPGPEVRIRDRETGKEKPMIMLGSNDYLGLSTHPRVREAVIRCARDYSVGLGGPPLLNGMTHLHRELELALASLKGKKDALLFASGYQANLGWLNALLRSGDVLIYDELNHASLFDAIRLVKSSFDVKAVPFRHNDLTGLARLLKKYSESRKPDAQIVVAVEGVYSMDGDLAPLPEVVALCKKYEAQLFVDDAHGTGVMGRNGGGTAEHFGVEDSVDLAMGTFSKVFGVTGGFIAGDREVIDYLRYFSRSYMFSAHLPPTTVAAVLEGTRVLREEPELRARLTANANYLRDSLNKLGYAIRSDAPILPVRIPLHVDARALTRALHNEGLFVNSIEYPAVPKSEQRLRLSVMATHEHSHLDRVIAIFEKLGRQFQMLS